MPGGVNAWRFQLAEEEEKRRRKFGWDDLFDLLQTAATGYGAIKGVQEAGKRTALAEERLGFDKEQAGIRETARQGEAMRGMEEGGYERVPTLTGGYGDAAKAVQMGSDMGRLHPDLGDTAWRAPPPEPTPEEELQAEIDRAAALSAATEERGGAPGQVFGGDRWQYPPDYGQQGVGPSGPSGPDIGRFRQWAMGDADLFAKAQFDAGDARFMDQYGENVNQGHPEWQRVYEEAFQKYMGGAPPPDEDDGMRLGAEQMRFAADFAQGNEEAIAEVALLEDPNNAEGDPEYAAIIRMLAQNMPQPEMQGPMPATPFQSFQEGAREAPITKLLQAHPLLQLLKLRK